MPILRAAAKAFAVAFVPEPAIASPAASLLRPEQRPDALELFFSSSGRLSRAPFLAGMGSVLGVLWLYDRWAGRGLRLATGWAVLAGLLFSGCCLVSRRLHDLGRAGWWTAAALALFVPAWPQGRGAVGDACAGVLGLLAIWLAAAPGQAAANRFGPAYVRGEPAG